MLPNISTVYFTAIDLHKGLRLATTNGPVRSGVSSNDVEATKMAIDKVAVQAAVHVFGSLPAGRHTVIGNGGTVWVVQGWTALGVAVAIENGRYTPALHGACAVLGGLGVDNAYSAHCKWLAPRLAKLGFGFTKGDAHWVVTGGTVPQTAMRTIVGDIRFDSFVAVALAATTTATTATTAVHGSVARPIVPVVPAAQGSLLYVAPTRHLRIDAQVSPVTPTLGEAMLLASIRTANANADADADAGIDMRANRRIGRSMRRKP